MSLARQPRRCSECGDEGGKHMRTARPEPSGFAAKAKDLQALRDAVVEASTVSGPLWISYIFVFLYLAISAGAVTHKDLFFENPVKLPFLNVELPLIGF